MLIDVMINSCARPLLLEKTLLSFKDSIYSEKHKFRWVLIEDVVRDKVRRQDGLAWIENHKEWFDKIHILKKKAGVGFWWQETIKYCSTDYHIHVEDDGEYLTKINIDPIIELMVIHDNIINIMFNRGNIRKINNLGKKIINGITLTEFRLMSVATGVFNTNNANRLLDSVGWDNKIHENSTLTPATVDLNFKKYILDHKVKHYKHIGAADKYRKGKYK